MPAKRRKEGKISLGIYPRADWKKNMAECNTLGVIVDGEILVIDHSIPSGHILNILVRGIF